MASSTSTTFCLCGDSTGFMVECESSLPSCPGNHWFHPTCLGLEDGEIESIETFICPSCKPAPLEAADQSGDEQPELVMDLDDDEEEEEEESEDEESYDVERILQHQDDDQGRWYLVKWKGYPISAATWQLEPALKMCYEPVAKYCKDNAISTELKAIGGADISEATGQFNVENWIKIDEVARIINSFSKIPSYSARIGIELVENLTERRNQVIKKDKDVIIIVLDRSHFYVIGYLAKEKQGYISDSRNMSSKKEVISRFSRHLGIAIKHLEFKRKLKVDQCGAGAIAIGLEFKRLIRIRNLGKSSLKPRLSMLSKLVNWVHKKPSQIVGKPQNISSFKRFTCDAKSCSFSTTTEKKLSMHKRKHSK